MSTQVDVAPASARQDTGPEEYDVVILGGGTGSTARGMDVRWRREAGGGD